LATLLFVVAQMSSLLHGMVRHATCAEHGELIEVSALASDHGQVVHDVDTLIAVGDDDDDDDHAHCPLSLHPGTSGPLGFTATTLALAGLEITGAEAEAHDSSVVVVAAVAVFSIAPKQGPPALPSPFLRSV
jgi:hypothetical protein